MKSKRGFIIFLYLIVTLLFIPLSYAEEAKNPNKTEDNKLRDNLILTEDMSDDSKESSAEGFNATISNSNNNEVTDEDKENKQGQYLDQKEAEINDKINRDRKVQESTTNSVNMVEIEPSNKTEHENVTDYSDEEFEEIIKNVTLDYDNNQGYEKAANIIAEALSKAHISREDSQKITDETNKIIHEYNQKIESAQSTEEKEALQREAQNKINQNIKENVSSLTSNTKEVNSIDSQKNEKLRIEVSPAGEETNKKTDKKDKNNTITLASLIGSRRSSQSKLRFMDSPIFAIAVIIVLTLSVSFSIALRKKEK